MLALRDHDDTVLLSHRALLAHTGPANRVAAALVYRLMRQAADTLSPGAPINRYGMRVLSAFSARACWMAWTISRAAEPTDVLWSMPPSRLTTRRKARLAASPFMSCCAIGAARWCCGPSTSRPNSPIWWHSNSRGAADAEATAAFRRAQADLAAAILDAPKGAVFEVRVIGDLPLRPTVQADDAGATITPDESSAAGCHGGRRR